MRRLVVVLGIPIDDLNMEETLERVCSFVEAGRRTNKGHQIVTVNADFVVNALQDPELRYLLQEADLATADGMPLVWGARMLGVSLEDRVAGADLVPALARRAAEKDYSIFLLGAAPGVAAKAAEILKAKNPGLKIAGVLSPPYSSVLEMQESILYEIQKANPDILLVAFGNPKQEKWIGMYGRRLNVPVMMGIGGTLDFIAGTTKRAPRFIQRIGLEWLHRLLQDPRRLWRRYLVDLVYFTRFFIKQWWIMRRGSQPAAILPSMDLLMVDGLAIINLEGSLNVSNHLFITDIGLQALSQTNHLVVNLQKTTFLDSTAIGSLIEMAKRAREADGDLVLAAVPKPIYDTLVLLRLDKYFLIYTDVVQVLVEKPHQKQQNAGAFDGFSVQKDKHKTDWLVVKCPRRLDAVTSDEFLDICSTSIENNPFLIIDLSETVFLASAGLAALARLDRLTAACGGELRITGCKQDTQMVIELARFDKVLSIYPDLSSALL